MSRLKKNHTETESWRVVISGGAVGVGGGLAQGREWLLMGQVLFGGDGDALRGD